MSKTLTECHAQCTMCNAMYIVYVSLSVCFGHLYCFFTLTWPGRGILWTGTYFIWQSYPGSDIPDTGKDLSLSKDWSAGNSWHSKSNCRVEIICVIANDRFYGQWLKTGYFFGYHRSATVAKWTKHTKQDINRKYISIISSILIQP